MSLILPFGVMVAMTLGVIVWTLWYSMDFKKDRAWKILMENLVRDACKKIM